MAGSNIVWFIIALAAAIIFGAVSIYNSLVKQKNFVEDAWSGIEAELKKRHIFIPNLVKTVK